jgi:hypothetical protein
MKEEAMREAFAVTGYVSADQAVRLRETREGVVELSPEQEAGQVSMRVEAGDVTEVRVGASRGKQTLVQLLLKDGATVETVVRHRATAQGLSQIFDPALHQLTASATAKKIMV